MIVQPPSTARLGAALRPPVTVRLRTVNGETAGEADNAETANLLAVATLTADSFNDSASPIDPNSLLEGRRFDSIHPFIGDDDLHGHETAETRGVGYVSFPNLVIRQEGTYRIRVTLIKVRSATGETSLASPGGSSVQVIDSNPIIVEQNATIDLDSAEDEGELLQSLRRSRTRRRSLVRSNAQGYVSRTVRLVRPMTFGLAGGAQMSGAL